MAKVTQIENLGVLYNVEDATARETAQAASTTATRAEGKADDNAEELLAISAKIPSSASALNKLATEADIPEVINTVTENNDSAVTSGGVFDAITIKRVAQSPVGQANMQFNISALPSGVYAIVAGSCNYQACSASYVYLFGLDRTNNVANVPCKIVNAFAGVSDPTVTATTVTIPKLGNFSRAYILKIA